MTRIRLSGATEQTWDLDGTSLSTKTSTFGHDTYGNRTDTSIAITDGVDTFHETQQSVYLYDEANWTLGLLTRQEATQLAPGQAPYTRVSEYEYADTVTWLKTREISEPDLPAFRLETSFTHDVFGNVIQTRGAAAGVADHAVGSFGYSPDGRLPISVTNMSGQVSTTTYDEPFSRVLSTTDNNGLTKTQVHDAFGNIVSTTGPDGIVTTVSATSSPDADAPPGTAFQITTQTTGSAPTASYHDLRGRTIKTRSTVFGNRTSSRRRSTTRSAAYKRRPCPTSATTLRSGPSSPTTSSGARSARSGRTALR